jgi:hypothetical protein
MLLRLAQVQLPIQPIPSPDPPTIALILGGSMALAIAVAWIYKGTHRGLSYSQSFQFSLVIIGMLGSAVMMVARVSLINALGLFGVFALVRFRTIVKDTKDMAYILWVLVLGVAMGTQQYALAVLTMATVGIVIVVLTRLNFGLATRHESVVRLITSPQEDDSLDTAALEHVLRDLTDTFTLLSAHVHGTRTEVSYGIRPKRGTSPLAVVERLSHEPGVENAELFDTKHQVEF